MAKLKRGKYYLSGAVSNDPDLRSRINRYGMTAEEALGGKNV